MNQNLNIQVEISHPAHSHFFKNPIKVWKKESYKVLIVAHNKEITHRLLDEIRFPYIPFTKQKTGFVPMRLV